MPNLATSHPIIVHFAIVLLMVGVIFRWISLTGRAAFTGPAAATLLLLGTLAAVLAVRSGTDAHGPVERIPGARDAVVEHEEAGQWTHNIFLLVAALELAALAVARRNQRATRLALWGSALLGVFGVGALYKAGDRGGDLVYRYAGGVGSRYGDSADVSRLYLAGLYQAAQQARAQHDSARAAELFGELARRFPNDTTVRFLAIESVVRDKNDGRAALAALSRLSIPPDNQRLKLRYGFLKADAYLAAGRPDSARATLEQLARDFPDMQRIKDRLAQIK
ncbi:MAG TPA: tetratricopeptide repeat protein [Gemmatimonadales bacterium]|nr:tetratricopeptide repeat protein [Gemmatimonadales bacterium]